LYAAFGLLLILIVVMCIVAVNQFNALNATSHEISHEVEDFRHGRKSAAQ
jgi:hypothetical protein